MQFYQKTLITVAAVLAVLAGIVFGAAFLLNSSMDKITAEALADNARWSEVAEKVENDKAFSAISSKIVMSKEVEAYESGTASFKANIPGGFIGDLITSIPSVDKALTALEDGDKLATERAANDIATKSRAQEEAQRFCLITSSTSDASVTDEQKQEVFNSKSMMTNLTQYREYCASKTATS